MSSEVMLCIIIRNTHFAAWKNLQHDSRWNNLNQHNVFLSRPHGTAVTEKCASLSRYGELKKTHKKNNFNNIIVNHIKLFLHVHKFEDIYSSKGSSFILLFDAARA